ncbi:MAG: dockerin type I domain-containing protein, partial [Phycisphaerae bacterium]
SDFEQDLGDEPAPVRKRVSLEQSDHQENEPPEPATPSAVNTPGDFNGDGRVDMNDFAQFQKCLAEGAPVSQACRAGDFDDDGDVDLIDYFEFQASVSQH